MRRLFLLARTKPSAFAGVEVSVAVLLLVLGGVLLPALRQEGKAAAHSQHADPAPEGQDRGATVPTGDDTHASAQPVIADGSVRKIKFDVNAGTFRQPAPGHDSRPLDEDY